MKVTVIPIVVGALGTVPKNLKKILNELKTRERIVNVQTTALLKSARIPRKVLETREDFCCLSDSSEKAISYECEFLLSGIQKMRQANQGEDMRIFPKLTLICHKD